MRRRRSISPTARSVVSHFQIRGSMMKIVVMSDTHGRHRDVEVPDGDVLVHAGDFTAHGSLADVTEVDDWLSTLPHPHKVVVAGNCDGCFESRGAAARERLTEAVYLQDDGAEIDGVRFWGSPWQPRFMNLAFNLERGEPLAEKWARIPVETDVLVTHGPPRDVLDRTSRGQVVGDRALGERVRAVEPDLHLFGHVHESAGRETKWGIEFVNAACDRPGKTPFVVEYGG
ncbi:MAG: metallophosphatase domain-containing protein [Bradymonadaceae bacterium]